MSMKSLELGSSWTYNEPLPLNTWCYIKELIEPVYSRPYDNYIQCCVANFRQSSYTNYLKKYFIKLSVPLSIILRTYNYISKYKLENKNEILDFLFSNLECCSALDKTPSVLFELFPNSELELSLEYDYESDNKWLQISVYVSGDPKVNYGILKTFNKGYWFNYPSNIRNKINILLMAK